MITYFYDGDGIVTENICTKWNASAHKINTWIVYGCAHPTVFHICSDFIRFLMEELGGNSILWYGNFYFPYRIFRQKWVYYMPYTVYSLFDV